MTGWFYSYYTTQQQQHTPIQKTDNLTTPEPLLPVSHFKSNQQRMQAALGSMQSRVQQSMKAFDQMQRSLMSDDHWNGLLMSPTMDMREFDDRYEVTFSLPNQPRGHVDAKLNGRILRVCVSNLSSNQARRGSRNFESRVMLPRSVESNATVSTTYIKGNLRVSISKKQRPQ